VYGLSKIVLYSFCGKKNVVCQRAIPEPHESVYYYLYIITNIKGYVYMRLYGPNICLVPIFNYIFS